MSFLDGYEDVNARIKRARTEYPGLRLVAYIEDIDLKNGYILIRAEAYKNYEDDKPSAVDYALEVRSERGVNANFWVENCVTSLQFHIAGNCTPVFLRSVVCVLSWHCHAISVFSNVSNK